MARKIRGKKSWQIKIKEGREKGGRESKGKRGEKSKRSKEKYRKGEKSEDGRE